MYELPAFPLMVIDGRHSFLTFGNNINSMSNLVTEFNDYRTRMNEVILGKENLVLLHGFMENLLIWEEMEEKLSTLQRIADWIAWFSGSMQFLIINALFFIVWIVLNVIPGETQFDPFPFGLLTMIVSLEAIFLSCFVLISQNRQSEKDHIRSDIEYEVNIKAELEIGHLHEKTDHLYEQMLERFNHIERILKNLGKKS